MARPFGRAVPLRGTALERGRSPHLLRLATLWLLWPASVWAGVSSTQAPERSQAERDEQAATQLEQALTHHPDDPVLHYNLGTTLYRQQAYPEATEAFNHAFANSQEALQGRIAYNLGNSQYRQGEAKETSAPTEALTHYQQAQEAYRMAIRQDPHDLDAKFNYELVEQRIKRVQEQQATTCPRDASQPKEAPAEQAHEQTAQDNATQGEPQPTQDAQPEQDQGATEAQPTQSVDDSAQEQDKQMSTSATPHEPGQELSRHQALWLLDTVQQEERRMPLDATPQASERTVEQNW